MKFKPLHDRVLIEVLDSSEKTAGGIIIPDTAQEKPQEGKVVAVGGGAKTEDGKLIPMDVKVGDKVLFFFNSSSRTFIACLWRLIPLWITPHKSI